MEGIRLNAVRLTSNLPPPAPLFLTILFVHSVLFVKKKKKEKKLCEKL